MERVSKVRRTKGKGEAELESRNPESLMGGTGGRKTKEVRVEKTESVSLNWTNRGPFGGCEATFRGVRFVVTEMGRDMWALDVYGEGGLIVTKTCETAYRCRLEAARMVGA